MGRTLTLAILPALICVENLNLSEVHHAADVKRREEEGRKFLQKLSGMEINEQREAHQDRRKEMIKTPGPRFPRLQMYRDAADALNNKDLFIHMGMELLFSNILVGCWMTFEMLATDLWIAAVNARPKTLGHNTVLVPSQAKNDAIAGSKDTPELKKQEPTFRFRTLMEEGFNISEKVGEFLKEQRRVNFDCLRDIRAAYYDAFRVQDHSNKYRISQPLQNLFNKSFDDLKSLEAIRNLIAHRGSVVDTKFKEELEEHNKKLAKLPEDQPLKVDAESALKYLMVVDGSCSELFRIVDNWLLTHNDSPK